MCRCRDLDTNGRTDRAGAGIWILTDELTVQVLGFGYSGNILFRDIADFREKNILTPKKLNKKN